jgi:hypothetical protein
MNDVAGNPAAPVVTASLRVRQPLQPEVCATGMLANFNQALEGL